MLLPGDLAIVEILMAKALAQSLNDCVFNHTLIYQTLLHVFTNEHMKTTQRPHKQTLSPLFKTMPVFILQNTCAKQSDKENDCIITKGTVKSKVQQQQKIHNIKYST